MLRGILLPSVINSLIFLALSCQHILSHSIFLFFPHILVWKISYLKFSGGACLEGKEGEEGHDSEGPTILFLH